MNVRITAAFVYDLIQCQHRPAMDLFADGTSRDDISPFVQLLWEKGTAYEHEVIVGLDVPILDLSRYTGDEKERKTLDAMYSGEPLIYSARISADELLGDPDLLRLDRNGYVAGDIKSGAGEFGEADKAKLKKHYGVQLALYTDILERKGLASSRRPFVWDVRGEEVTYDLDAPQGTSDPWTVWEVYIDALTEAQSIVSQTSQTKPAYSALCKLCHWYTACLKDMEQADDLTLLPELGRAKRDVMVDQLPTATDLASADVDGFISGKKTVFKGVGLGTLRKFQARAKLNTTRGAQAYLTTPISLPHADKELFFDIEVDPMRDHCYLHGFVQRQAGDNTTEKYVAFFADAATAQDEEDAFEGAWRYVESQQPCIMYYYSKYERTIWRKLQNKYSAVCTADDIEDLFHPSRSVDLYFDVVKKATEWPTRDHSIKTLATYLGFSWRDTHPSGAASIEWFDTWVRNGDATVKQRILAYNEDDCIATRVVLDGIRSLAV